MVYQIEQPLWQQLVGWTVAKVFDIESIAWVLFTKGDEQILFMDLPYRRGNNRVFYAPTTEQLRQAQADPWSLWNSPDANERQF